MNRKRSLDNSPFTPPKEAASWCVRLVSDTLSWSTWPLSAQPLLIGRSLGCHICIEDKSVSRIQCEVSLRDDGPYLRHRSQQTPTHLNGAPCTESTLRLGDLIEFSGHRLIVDLFSHDKPMPPREMETPPTTQRFDESVFLKEDLQHEEGDAVSGFASDLLSLLAIYRALAQCDSLDAMVEELRSQLVRKFENGTAWIAWISGRQDEMALLPPVSNEERTGAPIGALAQAAESQQGIHLNTPNASSPVVLAAPLRHGGVPFGAIAVQRAAACGNFSKIQLHYLLAVADGVAPLLLAAERMEQLHRDVRNADPIYDASVRMLGNSPAILELRENLTRAATGRGNVMLLGETGVGKELAARMLHDLSPRAGGPYIVVNCAAIPEELFESELFGHERGAFTGAVKKRKGLFEQAHGGTLFLDEVAELSPANQARLLRAVETSTFRRIGGDHETSVDVRIVSATNQALQEANEQRFRPDLFYRLASFVAWVPPLRDRADDIADIAANFLKEYAPFSFAKPVAFSSDAMAALKTYRWPGNVRELRNVVERTCYLTKGRTISAEDLALDVSKPRPTAPVPSRTLEDTERTHLLEVLKTHNSNVAQAAEALGIAASTLYYKLRRHKISLRNPQ